MQLEEIKEATRKYLRGSARAMQLATVAGDQPWVCSVYFVVDNNLNLYWLSYPSRRHSQEIAGNSKVAATVAIKFDQPVIGVQMEGEASEVTDAKQIAAMIEKYVAKYDVGHDFYENFLAGSSKHKMYKLTPKLFALFDEVNFRENGRTEWRTE